MRCIFKVFKEEGNQRKPQAGFSTLSQFRD
jgi:hypothetical protein